MVWFYGGRRLCFVAMVLDAFTMPMLVCTYDIGT